MASPHYEALSFVPCPPKRSPLRLLPSPRRPAAAASASCESRARGWMRSSRAWPARSLRRATATLAEFRDAQGGAIDQGIVLYFPAPHSYTGETVVEFHGHGGPVGDAPPARALRRARRAHRRARRVHEARVPGRQARPRAGGERRRPHRRRHRDRRARRGAQSRGRVLARDPRARRRADGASRVHRGDPRLSGGGHRVPARGRRGGPACGAARGARCACLPTRAPAPSCAKA